jgi:DNA-binding NtrC family response regulator
MRPRILIVDDRENMRKLFLQLFGEVYDIAIAADGAQALARVASEEFAVVLTDIRMPGADGFDVLRAVKQRWPETEVILMTAYASIAKAVDAMREGAYDYLAKPFEADQVALVVARAIEHRRRRRLANPLETGSLSVDLPDAASLAQMTYRDAVDAARESVSREYLLQLMREFGGNVTRAASRAGIERETLHRLLRRYGLRSEDFRGGG